MIRTEFRTIKTPEELKAAFESNPWHEHQFIYTLDTKQGIMTFTRTTEQELAKMALIALHDGQTIRCQVSVVGVYWWALRGKHEEANEDSDSNEA